ncbi:hypothetical protein HJG60_010444 [Phyllostomus discolor]|uniref:Uncharacterized protein n=1 Tax=Phyllostomus discolor TaxID=89673 RepID=A0A834ALA6_9CHIR|nr:hypothetical protein HJG60_010444 [Phyllostomus discolor]
MRHTGLCHRPPLLFWEGPEPWWGQGPHTHSSRTFPNWLPLRLPCFQKRPHSEVPGGRSLSGSAAGTQCSPSRRLDGRIRQPASPPFATSFRGSPPRLTRRKLTRPGISSQPGRARTFQPRVKPLGLRLSFQYRAPLCTKRGASWSRLPGTCS